MNYSESDESGEDCDMKVDHSYDTSFPKGTDEKQTIEYELVLMLQTNTDEQPAIECTSVMASPNIDAQPTFDLTTPLPMKTDEQQTIDFASNVTLPFFCAKFHLPTGPTICRNGDGK